MSNRILDTCILINHWRQITEQDVVQAQRIAANLQRRGQTPPRDLGDCLIQAIAMRL